MALYTKAVNNTTTVTTTIIINTKRTESKNIPNIYYMNILYIL